MGPFSNNFNFRRDHKKKFLLGSQLWVGRRKKPIFGHVPKNDEKKKKNLWGKGLAYFNQQAAMQSQLVRKLWWFHLLQYISKKKKKKKKKKLKKKQLKK